MITVTHTYAGNFVVPPSILNRRRQGIPPGGPADPYLSAIALHLANSDTCLEITTPITLFTDEPTQIALAAPPSSQCLSNHPTASLALLPLLPGEPLTIQSPQSGYRIYLSWPGLTASSRFPQLITIKTTFPAKSTPIPKFLSINSGFTISTLNTLFFLPIQEIEFKSSPSPEEEAGNGEVKIQCQTTPHISRIGTRLDPSPQYPESSGDHPSPSGEGQGWGITGVIHKPLTRSEPSLHGAIQVTPDHLLLVHGPDGPTLGGYPKLGSIIQASLPTLAQLRPNQSIQLQETTLEEAHNARHDYNQQLAQTLAQIDQALSIAH